MDQTPAPGRRPGPRSGPDAFPIRSKWIHELNQPLRLSRIVAVGLQVEQQILLRTQALPPVLDVGFRPHEQILFGPELLGSVNGAANHARHLSFLAWEAPGRATLA